MKLFHYACGHYGLTKMRLLARILNIKLVGDENDVRFCESCMIGKSKRLPRFSVNTIERAQKPGIILHIDSSGPWATRSIGGKRYKFSVTDDYSLFILDFYLAHKNEFVDCLKQAVAFYERQTGNKVKEIRADQEFHIPEEIIKWWKNIRFIWKTSATNDKDGNPIAEKVNDITAGPARAMRYHAKLPPQFWAELEHAATTIHNILPAIHGERKGISPYEQLLGRKPTLFHLKPIGCMGVLHVPKTKVRKGEYRGKKVILVGYDLFRELYRVWDGKKIISGVRDVRFNIHKIGKQAHPPKLVSWDNDDSEGENENASEQPHTTPQESPPQSPPQSPKSPHNVNSDHPTTQFDEAEGEIENVDVNANENEHACENDHVEKNTLDNKNTYTSPEPHYPQQSHTEHKIKPQEHRNEHDPTDPLKIHERRAYEEKSPPSKGLTWEQSQRVTESNIIPGTRQRKVVERFTPSNEPKREKREAQELIGKVVRVPARAWGDGWAKKKYGEGWESIVRVGVVSRVCDPRDRLVVRDRPQPTHIVKFEDEEERMLNSEILKYSVKNPEYPLQSPANMFICDDRMVADEIRDFYLYVDIRVPKDIIEVGLTAKDVLEGMKAELKALQSFNTYTWVPHKEASKAGVSKIVRLTWVHKVKLDENGKKFIKSRLALRGDMLEPGVSYNPDQLFVPCAAHHSLLFLAKLAAWHKHKLYGIDFKNAYLNARMNDPVYAYAPESVDREGHKGMIWRIDGALYGAPQAGRRWYEILAPKLEELGFRLLDSDLCMFVENDKALREAIVGIFHVDDLLFTAPNKQAYERFASALEKHFPLKRLGIAREFKGIEIEQSNGKITLHQRKYQQQILKEVGYDSAKPVSTPAQEHFTEPMSESASLRKFSIPSLVGRLLFLAKMTRPDIEQALNSASVMQTIDKGITYAMIGRIFRYLVNSYRGLAYHEPKSEQEGQTYPKLSMWPDAAHKVCKKTGKSRTGFVILWGSDPVAWLSKRQSRIALSSNDAEIFAATECIREGLALKHITQELNIAQKSPIELFEDNSQTVLAAERGMSGNRTKHLPLELHFMHHLQRDGEIKFVKVGTKKQIGDVMTKHLPKEQFEYLLNKFTVKLK